MSYELSVINGLSWVRSYATHGSLGQLPLSNGVGFFVPGETVIQHSNHTQITLATLTNLSVGPLFRTEDASPFPTIVPLSNSMVNIIVAIRPSHQILDRFSSFSPQFIDLHAQFLLPGFVNTHVHTSQQLGRGITDDVDLLTWLHHRVWPYESTMTLFTPV